MARTKFCGNPHNHEQHPYEEPFDGWYICEGVGRIEVKEEIVEKWKPDLDVTVKSEDGQKYVKVTILVEDGNKVTRLTAEKVVDPYLDVEYEHELFRELRSKPSRISKVNFSFKPFETDEGVSYKVEKEDKDISE